MPFLMAFFVLFSTMTLLYKVVNRCGTNLLDLGALLANAGLFFAVGRSLIIEAYGRPWVAELTLGLALFYIIHVYAFLARKLVDRELLVCFMGLAAFFLAITMPIVLSPQWITASWAIQALVMLWMAQQIGSVFLRHVSYVSVCDRVARFMGLDLGNQFLHASSAADVPVAEFARRLVERVLMFGIPIASIGGRRHGCSLEQDRTTRLLSPAPTTRPTSCNLIGPCRRQLRAGHRALGRLFELGDSSHFGLRLCSAPALADAHVLVAGILRLASVASDSPGKPGILERALTGAHGSAGQAVCHRRARVGNFRLNFFTKAITHSAMEFCD